VLAVWHRRDVLEEPPFIGIFGREVDREAGLGRGESTVDVAVSYWRIAPLVDIDIRFGEHLVHGFGLCGLVHGANIACTIPAVPQCELSAWQSRTVNGRLCA
jgi:hypothetical protein